MRKRKPEKMQYSRKNGKKSPRKIVKIYCNGEVTEKKYFESMIADLHLSSVKIEVTPSERARKSLVDWVKKKLKADSYKIDADHQVWVVFDVDAHQSAVIDQGANSLMSAAKNETNEAFTACKACKYGAIISNDCFELWFLLHYKYITTHFHRKDLVDNLSKAIKMRYEKNTPMYELLKELQGVAIKNARNLCNTYPDATRMAERTPYTNVHELVEALNSMKQKELENSKKITL